MTLHVDGFSDVTPLAGGGFGSVYQATRSSTGGVIALKVLDRGNGDDADLLERRLRREIAALVALKGHPNVVQVEQVVSTVQGPAIVMEFMSRGSVLDSDLPGQMRPARVAFIGAATAAGLQAAHHVGIVHRDVKPQNILVNNFGQVKLCDFGIAAIQKSAEFQTHTTALSVRYASPEELDNDPNITAPTDVYSLGASMFHLMFGDPPSFRGGRGADPALMRQRGADPAADAVAAIIERCLSEDPSQRPSAGECVELFSELADSSSRLEPLVRTQSPTAQRRKQQAAERGDDTQERPDRGRRGAGNGQRPSGDPIPDTSGSSRPNPLPATSNERWWE